MKPSYFISPYDGIVEALKEIDSSIEVVYSEGARSKRLSSSISAPANICLRSAYRTMPTLDYDLLTEDGKPGWTCSWYTHENDSSMVALPDPIKSQYVDETRVFIR